MNPTKLEAAGKKVISLLDQIHGLWITARAATQRELFYKLLNVFDTQAQVNSQLQQIVKWLEIPRSCLNVFASQKGLVAGMVTFCKGSASLDCRNAGTGILVSETLLEVDRIESKASYIVVVEKEAVFQTLTEQQIWNILFFCMTARKNMMAAQCGYVGDFDPHGISIFLSYQYGSSVFEGRSLSCVDLHWIGMCSEDLERLPAETRLSLSGRDRALLQNLFDHPTVKCCERLKQQCIFMLHHDTKFEIEAIASLGLDYLGRYYIPSRILKRTWI
ncbi:putative topoisomerase VIA [Besnoitia besnoiti]|uniref:DNA topoisomerase (ATP-hydrolyzing) n=1 Tax=Besnoitia besnoiti TaxID=94643 RepID=A0A2A9M9W4_BESBE|nr:putative topoisomerase VIA [Besnoitia besnoiti]PFH32726.1 putative topoisomerase VIA [Besnoitia besnoiti]